MVFAHLNEPPPPITSLRPELPEAFDGVFATALAKSPEERYSSCGELVEAARAALQGKALAHRKPRRRRFAAALVVLVAAGATIGALFATRGTHTAPVSISPTAIAGARLGLSDADYKRLWGVGWRKASLDTPPGYSMLTNNVRKVSAYFTGSSDKAVEITTWNKSDRTRAGVGPCSTVTQLKAAYGSKLKPAKGSVHKGKVYGYTLGKNLFFAIGLDVKHVEAVALFSNPFWAGYNALNEPPCSGPDSRSASSALRGAGTQQAGQVHDSFVHAGTSGDGSERPLEALHRRSGCPHPRLARGADSGRRPDQPLARSVRVQRRRATASGRRAPCRRRQDACCSRCLVAQQFQVRSVRAYDAPHRARAPAGDERRSRSLGPCSPRRPELSGPMPHLLRLPWSLASVRLRHGLGRTDQVLLRKGSHRHGPAHARDRRRRTFSQSFHGCDSGGGENPRQSQPAGDGVRQLGLNRPGEASAAAVGGEPPGPWSPAHEQDRTTGHLDERAPRRTDTFPPPPRRHPDDDHRRLCHCSHKAVLVRLGEQRLARDAAYSLHSQSRVSEQAAGVSPAAAGIRPRPEQPQRSLPRRGQPRPELECRPVVLTPANGTNTPSPCSHSIAGPATTPTSDGERSRTAAMSAGNVAASRPGRASTSTSSTS